MTKTRKNRPSNGKTKKKRVFKKGDFYSGDGFLTTVWGPAVWHTLHTISFNYPVSPSIEQKKRYRNFVLPLTMKVMESRDTFSRYIYNLHELINRMLKKKSNLTYCDVRERYEHFRSRCVDEKPKVFKYSEIKTQKNRKEKGCTEPLYGKKARCILNIVPQDEKGQSIQIDKKCMKHRE